MSDLTILFLTVNKVPEGWAEYHKKVLLEAAGDFPIITISKKPLDWGTTNIIQNEPISTANIYRQVLRGAKIATTPFIAIAEDDVLYNKEHFLYRPPMDTFAYNMHRWGIFTWGKPTFFMNNRIHNAEMIAPRELTIEALEERFAKYPGDSSVGRDGELGKNRIEDRLGLTRRNHVEFYTTVPIVAFNHDYSLDPLELNHRKRMGTVQAFDIPLWGRSEELVKKFQ